MALKEEFENQGNWLFRWRSYFPALAVIFFISAFSVSRYPFLHSNQRLSWEILCMLVSFAGLGIRIATVGFVPSRTSGRNTKKQIADKLNTSGIYSTVRHPLYFGNFLIVLGLSLLFMVWWLVVIISLSFWVYYERIMYAEEAFLRSKFGEDYAVWASKTPAFIPNFGTWRSPDMTLSLRTIIKREYTGLFGIITLFTVLHFSGQCYATGNATISSGWAALFSANIFMYLMAIVIKKKTRLLHVNGR